MYQHPHLYIRTSQALKKTSLNHLHVFSPLFCQLCLLCQGTRKTKETHGLFHDFPGKAAFPEPALDPGGSPWDRGWTTTWGRPPRGTKRWKHVLMLGGSLFHGISLGIPSFKTYSVFSISIYYSYWVRLFEKHFGKTAQCLSNFEVQ